MTACTLLRDPLSPGYFCTRRPSSCFTLDSGPHGSLSTPGVHPPRGSAPRPPGLPPHSWGLGTDICKDHRWTESLGCPCPKTSSTRRSRPSSTWWPPSGWRDAGVPVYVTHTGTRDVTGRLDETLTRHGFRVAVMKADAVAPVRREAWVADNASRCVFLARPR